MKQAKNLTKQKRRSSRKAAHRLTYHRMVQLTQTPSRARLKAESSIPSSLFPVPGNLSSVVVYVPLPTDHLKPHAEVHEAHVTKLNCALDGLPEWKYELSTPSPAWSPPTPRTNENLLSTSRPTSDTLGTLVMLGALHKGVVCA